jgi:hypothetical protein
MTSKILKLSVVLFALVMAFSARAQDNATNMPEHDAKPYYFGITFGINYSSFRINQSKSFALYDTFTKVQPKYKPGFNIGLMGSLRLGKFVDLRFIPALVLAEKDIVTQGLSDTTRVVESIYMQLPLQLKFKSDRINNFRFYGIIGSMFNYDLAANVRSRRQDEWLRISPIDFGAEVGFGLEFYYPNFIFAPEIKISQGFINTNYADSRIPLSNTIDRMTTRMFVISFHLQG